MAFMVTDYTGKKFNHLHILRPLGSPGPGKHCVWEMRCDCGALVNKSGHDVARGSTKTCGQRECKYRQAIAQHARNSIRLTPQERKESRLDRVFKDYQRKTKHEFKLTYAEFRNLIVANCYYCGSTDDRGFGGVDRRDNSVGYQMDNCVPCCKHCNFMKHTLTVDAFLAKVRAIHAIHK